MTGLLLGAVVSPVIADIVPPPPVVDPLFECPSVILDGESRLLSYVDVGPGSLPNGNPYCRYNGNYGGDWQFASYDRVLGRAVMFGAVMHGTPGTWIAHSRDNANEFALLSWVAHSQCNEAVYDWYVNMSICSDRNFIGVFLKSELDVIPYTGYTLYPGDIGVSNICHYGEGWVDATCNNLIGWVDPNP